MPSRVATVTAKRFVHLLSGMLVIILLTIVSTAQSGHAAGDLFRGDYETGNFSQWDSVQALPGDATIVTSPTRQGNYAARFQVNPGDNPLNCCAGSERSEVYASTGETAGVESWWAWSTYFPSDFNVRPELELERLHATGTTPARPDRRMPCSRSMPWRAQPNLLLAVYGGDFNNPATRGFTLAPFERNRWFDFVFHVKWEPDATGFVEVWLNGQLVVPKTYLPTIYSGQSVYLKEGFYRPSYSLPTVLYQDGMRRGTSYADVAAGFGGTSSTPAPSPAPALRLPPPPLPLPLRARRRARLPSRSPSPRGLTLR